MIAFESSAKSKYDGLTLDLQRRFANNWQGRIAWTHSTVKDNKPDATAVVPFSSGDDGKYASDPKNLELDYTYGDNDVRDRLVLSGVWSSDGLAQGMNGVSRAFVGGWTVSGIASYQSGQPFTPGVSADLKNDGNPSNDIAPDERRNSQRLPSQISIDPRIAKDIPLFGAAKLQLIAEAFNVLDRSNVNSVNRTKYAYNATTKVFTPNAAYLTPALSVGPRIIQLAAKLSF